MTIDNISMKAIGKETIIDQISEKLKIQDLRLSLVNTFEKKKI